MTVLHVSTVTTGDSFSNGSDFPSRRRPMAKKKTAKKAGKKKASKKKASRK